MAKEKIKRNNKLFKMRLIEGKTFAELGDYFGITRSQAEAIFKRMLSKIKIKDMENLKVEDNK